MGAKKDGGAGDWEHGERDGANTVPSPKCLLPGGLWNEILEVRGVTSFCVNLAGDELYCPEERCKSRLSGGRWRWKRNRETKGQVSLSPHSYCLICG